MISVAAFSIMGILCILYGFAILAARSGSFFWVVWEAFGALFLLTAWLRGTHFFERHRTFGILLALLGAAFAVFVGVMSFHIVGAFVAETPENLDYLIVLGAQVRENGPSAILRFRLDAAADYLKENPETVCVVSGGKGYNEPFAEAQGMYGYLVKAGIEESRILREEKSKNTAENIRFSRELIPEEAENVGIVTNDFHVYRAVLLARKGGFPEARGVPAPSVAFYLPNNILRECFALVKEKLTGSI